MTHPGLWIGGMVALVAISLACGGGPTSGGSVQDEPVPALEAIETVELGQAPLLQRTLRISADHGTAAWLAPPDEAGRLTVVRNGEPIASELAAVLDGSPFVGASGAIAWGERGEAGWRVAHVLPGSTEVHHGPWFNGGLARFGVAWSADGRTLAYVGLDEGDGKVVVVQKAGGSARTFGPYADVSPPQPSVDGRALFGTLEADGSLALRIDGEVVATGHNPVSAAWSADGGQWAVVGRSDAGLTLLTADGSHGPWPQAGAPTFGGGHLALAVLADEGWRIWRDGELLPSPDLDLMGGSSPALSADGAHTAWWGQQGPDAVVVVDGEERARHLKVLDLPFQFVGDTLTYAAQGPDGPFLQIGDTAWPVGPQIATYAVAPDAGAAAAVAGNGRLWHLELARIQADGAHPAAPGRDLVGFASRFGGGVSFANAATVRATAVDGADLRIETYAVPSP